MKKLVFTVMLALLSAGIYAQTRQQMGGIYYAYQADPNISLTPVPKGYSLVYISHYGRYGSSWLGADVYKRIADQFADASNLTATGLETKKSVDMIVTGVAARAGQLTIMGNKQVGDIAERMYNRFPEVFDRTSHLRLRCSTESRAKATMGATSTKLLNLKAMLHMCMDAATNQEDMNWIAAHTAEQQQLETNTPAQYPFTADRFVKNLFKDPKKIANPMQFMTDMFALASNTQNADNQPDLYDIFTDDELFAFYKENNRVMSLCNGLNSYNKRSPQRCSIGLWQDIEEDADGTISKGGTGACFRFGDEGSLYRLLTTIQLSVNGLSGDGQSDEMDQVMPTASNLQILFYKNQKNVLVKFLYNEKEATLPMATDMSPYYNWEEVKTMVGNMLLVASSR